MYPFGAAWADGPIMIERETAGTPEDSGTVAVAYGDLSVGCLRPRTGLYTSTCLVRARN